LLLIAAPALAQTPDLTVCGENKPFSLVSAQPAEGVGEITYKWYENDIPIDNSNTASICIAEGRAGGTYAYVRKASSEACPEEAASNTYRVRVVATPAPTLTRSAETVCAGHGAITFTATGGIGTYEWSCTGDRFNCSGIGAITQTTPTSGNAIGTYTASVRSVNTSNGTSCYSEYSSLSAVHLGRAGLGQAPTICGCSALLCPVDGVCTPMPFDCQACRALCEAAGMTEGVRVRDLGTSSAFCVCIGERMPDTQSCLDQNGEVRRARTANLNSCTPQLNEIGTYCTSNFSYYSICN
jgi:hypothetical protein